MTRFWLAPLLVTFLLAQAPPPAPKKSAPAAAKSTNPVDALKFPPLREVKVPDVTTFTLANGIKVYMLANHELPVINGFALVRTGNLFDPKEKIGLTDIVGTVMRTGGTKDKTGEQLNEQLENIAASVESSLGETSGRVSFNCLKENVDEVLAVFKNLLIAPEFRPDKLDLAKMQQKSGIQRRNEDPGGIASREFTNTLYGKDTPFGWQTEHATIDAIQRADLIAFHQRYFFPRNTVFAVYGDFDEAAMRARIEKLFADWTVEQPAVPAFPKVNTQPQPGVFLAVKTNVNQSSFRIGHLAGTLRDADYPALEVMAEVLGGSPFTSRLGRAIRVERGLAYQIGARWGANYDHPGTFQIIGGTKSESTVPAIQTIQEEIRKFMSVPPSAAELQSAKDKILNAFVFNFANPSQTLSRMVNYDYWGYPKDFIFTYQKAVEKVTSADVLRVAKQYLKPENFTYVVVGKPTDFKTPLSGLNMPVKEIDLTIPQARPATPPAKPTGASIERGRALLAKSVEALGGEKLTGVRDFTSVREVAMGPAMKGKQRVQWVSPGIYRQELDLPGGKIIAFFDGQGGWMKSPQGEQAMDGAVLSHVRLELFRDLHTLVRSASMADRTVNYIGEGVVEIRDGAGNSTRLVVDEATGMPKKQMFEAASMSGAPVPSEMVYEGFRDVGGVKVPESVVIMQNAQKTTESKLVEVQLNSGLKPEDLAKKQ